MSALSPPPAQALAPVLGHRNGHKFDRSGSGRSEDGAGGVSSLEGLSAEVWGALPATPAGPGPAWPSPGPRGPAAPMESWLPATMFPGTPLDIPSLQISVAAAEFVGRRTPAPKSGGQHFGRGEPGLPDNAYDDGLSPVQEGDSPDAEGSFDGSMSRTANASQRTASNAGNSETPGSAASPGCFDFGPKAVFDEAKAEQEEEVSMAVQHSAGADGADGAHRLATGSDDGRLRVEDGVTGRLSFEVPRKRLLWSVAWSPTGHKVACAGDDCKLCVVNSVDGSVDYEIDHARPVRGVAWCPQGRRIATISGRDLRVLDAASGRQGLGVPHRTFLVALAWRPDGNRIATGSEDKRLQIRNADTGDLLLEVIHHGVVHSLAWKPGGSIVATGCGDGIVRLVDAANSAVTAQFSGGAAVRAVAWNPKGTLLAIGIGGGMPGVGPKARVFEVESGRCRLEVSTGGFVRALAWDALGQRIAVGSDDGVLRIVNYYEQRVERSETLGGYVRAVAWSRG